MKVDGPLDSTYLSQSNPAAAGAAGETRAAQATSPTQRGGRAMDAQPKADQATLSDRARLLQKAHAALDSAPDIREDKVEQIKADIARGSYRIDLRAIAERIQTLLK